MGIIIWYTILTVFNNMNKEVLLINPDFPDSVLRPMVPAGLLAVAGEIDKFGMPVKLHDERIMGEFEPDNIEGTLVGITAMTSQAKRAKELAKVCKNAGAYGVLFGGIHPTVCTKEMARHGVVLKGEIEGGSLNNSLVDYKNDNVLKERYFSPLSDLNDLPLSPPHIYSVSSQGQWEIVSNARGCPMGCEYCTVSLVAGSKIRTRPTHEVIEEMETRGLFSGVEGLVTFGTDTFGTKKDRELLRQIGERVESRRFHWLGQVGIKTFNDESFLKLADSVGTANLAVGIESPFRKDLESVKRGIRGVDPVEAFKRAGKYQNIERILLLMVGFDWEPKDRFERLFEYVKLLHPEQVYLSILTPLPGSQTADKMQRQKRITDRDWNHYDTRHLVFEPRYRKSDGSFGTMTYDDFMDGYRWLLKAIAEEMDGWDNQDKIFDRPVR